VTLTARTPSSALVERVAEVRTAAATSRSPQRKADWLAELTVRHSPVGLAALAVRVPASRAPTRAAAREARSATQRFRPTVLAAVRQRSKPNGRKLPIAQTLAQAAAAAAEEDAVSTTPAMSAPAALVPTTAQAAAAAQHAAVQRQPVRAATAGGGFLFSPIGGAAPPKGLCLYPPRFKTLLGRGKWKKTTTTI